MTNQFIIEHISAKFSEIVRTEFNGQELDNVNELNKHSDYKECCATQDYCDANELMAAAFEYVMKREINLQDQNDIELWNNAWDMSKENQFKS